MLQDELEADGVTDVQLLGINGVGLEAGNPLATEGRDIPWLQDVAGVDMWTTWDVGYRDVWILDRENRLLTIYNLTEHDLNQPANFEELRLLLLDAAQR